SKEAELFSEGKPIELLDGFKLIKLIKLTESNKKVVIPKVTQSVCPKCGSSLILKSGKYGEFYGCTKYPECKFTKST
ncbi:MAG TPA: topoisomerase DNA-binding C4 zinc finger domain-containing protein, partial [Candidatus Dojkabacteria bacterium]|nr:topoisomerase DNA-binding C4 zinc finger domain-containing protein [Candidatus Dojkabacteria bacterium]